MQTTFYIAGAIAVIATVMTITRLNAVHALLYLIVSLLAVSVAFYALGAPFVAALEMIIYAGAIMVLFVFVVMMMNLGQRAVEKERSLLSGGMWVGPGILAALLITELVYMLGQGDRGAHALQMVDPKQVGIALYGPYLIGVELASMLLLGGLVGAYHLGWRRERKEGRDRGFDSRRVDAGGHPVRVGADGGAGTPEHHLHPDVD
jgi:NADH-quinone oxidoreductase subunit J